VRRRPIREFARIAIPYVMPRVLDLPELSELGVEDGRVQLAHQIAGTDVGPGVLVYLAPEEARPVGALLADDLSAFEQLRVIDHERATLARVHVLGVVEALGGERTECSQRASVERSA